MPVDLQYDLANDTPASATLPQSNFSRLEQYINQEAITRDGVTAMVAQLKLVGDPVSPLDAATKQYVDAVMPVGIVMMYVGAAAPPGGRWALANGAEVEVAVYPELAALMGATTGSFNLPNLVNRFPIGGGTIVARGAAGGTADIVTVAHTHTIDHAHAAGTSGTDSVAHVHGGVDHLHSVNIQSSGQSNQHYHRAGGVGWDNYVMYDNEGGGYGAGAGGVNFGLEPSTHWNEQDHSHGVNGYTGAVDRSLTTGTPDQLHTHNTTIPAYAGASGSTGVAPTNTNIPPCYGVMFIVRVS